MSTIGQWEIRRRGGGKTASLTDRQLAAHVASGSAADGHEVRPAGAEAWMTIDQARPFLPKVDPAVAPATTSIATSTPSASSSPGVPTRPSSAATAATPASLPPPASMRGTRRRSGWGDDASELDMTPMIDMTFLLLIFFMVTSTLSPFADLELPQATAGDAEKPEGRAILVVDYPDETAKGAGRLDGSLPVTLADCRLYLPDHPEDLIPADQLQDVLTKEIANCETGDFLLQSNRKMPLGVVREIVKIAGQAGANESMIGVSRPK